MPTGSDYFVEKTKKWSADLPGGYPLEGISALSGTGGLVVSPTKVGYVLTAVDKAGLERKFDAKNRKRNKPGVVLVSDLEQLHKLAQLNPEITALYQRAWDEDVLLGCILPWQADAYENLIPYGAQELMTDLRKTSCFVIKYGLPTEKLVQNLWANTGKLVFASSANPSGVGNKGKVAGIGERIAKEADVIVSADDYVLSIQPDRDASSRYEQGVMVSMVDENGALVPEQGGQREVFPAPVVIRKGLAIDEILSYLADIFTTWDYRHGQYY